MPRQREQNIESWFITSIKVNVDARVSTSHIVNEVPSTAMNPFGIMYLMYSAGTCTLTLTEMRTTQTKNLA